MQDNRELLPPEAQQYLDSNPNLREHLERAERVYKVFTPFLDLTENRTVVRESRGSTTEADLSAALSRTNF